MSYRAVPRTSAADLIDQSPVSRLQITVFALCIIISIFDGFSTQSIAFVAPSISREWGLSRFQFGFVFSGTLLGSVIGSSVFGMLADRLGRKQLCVWSTLLFGVGSALCAVATNFDQLLAFRLIGGIGLGGAIPNTMAMASEYAPARRRATIVSFTLWGFPAGSILGGIISGPMIGAFGWRSVFVLGALAPLALVPVLAIFLPESLRFAAADPARRATALLILRRIAPDQAGNVAFEGEGLARSPKAHLSALFAPDIAATTILLAAALFSSLFLTYLLVNWIPIMLTASGMSISQAILGTVAINVGGIAGCYLLARAIDRQVNALVLLSTGYLFSAVALLVVGSVSGSAMAVLGSLTLCGMFLIGSQMSMTAFTATQFPVHIRGTGIGLVQAFGRIGSLIGPVIGGMLLTFGLSPASLFHLSFIPALLSALLLLTLGMMRNRRAGIDRAKRQREAVAQ